MGQPDTGGPTWMPMPAPGLTDGFTWTANVVWAGVAGGRLLIARHEVLFHQPSRDARAVVDALAARWGGL
jgi:hypothetical protein